MREIISTGLLIVGVLALWLAWISGIGYTLYLWGSVGLAFGASAWEGFVLWLKFIGVGLFGVIGGIVTKD